MDALLIASSERAEEPYIIFPRLPIPELQAVNVGLIERLLPIDGSHVEVALLVFRGHTRTIEHEPEPERLICICEIIEPEPEMAHRVVVAQEDIPDDHAIRIGVFD